MGVDGLQWVVKNLPFAAGLQQGTDVRARPEPYLDICRDVHFDDDGGLQTRFPFAAAAGSIFGGGTISNARRIVRNGDEDVLFTADSVYSWNAQLSKWVLRGTHLAVKVDESPAFATTGDQIDGDRAELSGTVVFAWTEQAQVFAAAIDKATGSVMVAPTAVSTAVGRPRLVALATTILLFADAGSSTLAVHAIDPASPAAGIIGSSAGIGVATDFGGYYDVVRAGTQDLAVGAYRRTTTTAYAVFTVGPTLVSVTKTTKARTCDGPIAVSTIPDGTKTQIIRANGTNIQGDFLTTSTLADVTTGQAIGTASGTPVNQIAAAHRSVQNGGAFRCYVFWSALENAGFGALFLTKVNFVDSAGTIGTQATFVLGLAPASRAIDYNGSVYLWMAFGLTSQTIVDLSLAGVSQAQNAYLLYRDDAFIAAKSVYNAGGGLRPTTGLLPGIALTASNTYSWCATSRRRQDLGGGSTAFAARSPRDVTFTFDSNEARRCARLGATLYVAAGEVLQYDGLRLTEAGFHFYPWSFQMLAAGTGSVASGGYGYKITWRWTNAAGESERSTTAAIAAATLVGGPAGFALDTISPLAATHKTMIAGAIAVEVWRTAVNPVPDSPYFLATSPDPTNATNPNKYLANDPTTAIEPGTPWRDEMADAVLTIKEANPENGAVLENLSPPGASVIFASDTRLFLLDVAGDPDRGWYSKLRGNGQVAAFHDTLVFDIPRDGGKVTAGWFDQNGVLYVARETAIYAFTGGGLDNLGQGQNYTLGRIVSLDIGVTNFESVALTPRGTIFKSRKGWYVQHEAADPQLIGQPVEEFNDEAVLAVTVIETKHRVQILTAARMLFWDYRVNQWGEWTVSDGVHMCIFGGALVYLAANGTRTQLATYTGVDYGPDIETVWIKPSDVLQGASQVRKLQPLGEYRGDHLLRFRIAYNYQQDSNGVPTYVDDKAWLPSPTVVGGPLQVKHGPKRRLSQAIKLRLTACRDSQRASMSASGGLPAALTHAVETDSAPWAGQLLSLSAGEIGNATRISLAFEDGAPFVIDVRDHLTYNPATGLWSAATGTCGVRIACRAGSSPTVAQLEAALSADSLLVQVAAADPAPTKIIDATAMLGIIAVGTFSGGVFAGPTGEALKLTSLGLELGVDPGLYRRLPAAQQQ